MTQTANTECGANCKLHIAVDTSTHKIIVAELSLSTVTDAEVLPNLFKQTRRQIVDISDDGTYDTKGCYTEIRVKRTVALILSREEADHSVQFRFAGLHLLPLITVAKGELSSCGSLVFDLIITIRLKFIDNLA